MELMVGPLDVFGLLLPTKPLHLPKDQFGGGALGGAQGAGHGILASPHHPGQLLGQAEIVQVKIFDGTHKNICLTLPAGRGSGG